MVFGAGRPTFVMPGRTEPVYADVTVQEQQRVLDVLCYWQGQGPMPPDYDRISPAEIDRVIFLLGHDLGGEPRVSVFTFDLILGY